VIVDGMTDSPARVAWRLTHGPIVPAKPFVCHRCDNPTCYRPTHLFTGTQKDNLQDAAKKGRMPRGDANAASRPEVREKIRRWHAGRPLSGAHRRSLGKAGIRRWQSPQARKVQSEKLLRWYAAPAARAALSAVRQAQWDRIPPAERRWSATARRHMKQGAVRRWTRPGARDIASQAQQRRWAKVRQQAALVTL
jgi:hypothetical protein